MYRYQFFEEDDIIFTSNTYSFPRIAYLVGLLGAIEEGGMEFRVINHKDEEVCLPDNIKIELNKLAGDLHIDQRLQWLTDLYF